MIQANELRIGNYIMNYGGNNDFEVSDEWMLSNWDVIKYQPILITEEWLIDLGFEDIGGHEYQIDHDLIVENEYTENGFWNFVYGNAYITRIKSVHQLQNLYFAITGKELIKQKPASNR